MIKKLLLGDEALALGAIHAGLSGVYAYPGTPSTEITEYIQADPVARQRGVHSRWCTNEKTAMEAALGMSYAGKRALVCMKHVGMNVCADAFVNAAVTGVNGGVVIAGGSSDMFSESVVSTKTMLQTHGYDMEQERERMKTAPVYGEEYTLRGAIDTTRKQQQQNER